MAEINSFSFLSRGGERESAREKAAIPPYKGKGRELLLRTVHGIQIWAAKGILNDDAGLLEIMSLPP